MDAMPSCSPYIQFDSRHGQSGRAPATREEPETSQRRSPRGPCHPERPVRAPSNAIVQVRSNRNSRITAKGDPSARTTFAQLQVATVRGGISASEEQAGVERSQRDRDAIRYHAAEAVRAGNDAASAKRDDPDLIVNVPPPLQRVRLAPDGGGDSAGGRSPALNGVGGTADDDSGTGSEVRTHRGEIRSARRKFWARRGAKTPEEKKDGPASSTRSAADSLERKVAQMKRKILMESHDRSGARSLDSNAAEEPDPRARARVKLIIEQSRVAEAYIRLGLQSDAEISTSRMIEMIDYYCN